MALYQETNTATASVTIGGTPYTRSADAEFEATNELEIVITKTVDKPGEVYYDGETIIFTITMTRVTGMQSAINGITLTDTFPDIVSYDETDISLILGTGGLIDVTGQTLTIENLVLSNGNPTIIYQVTGTIVIP